MLLSSVSLGSRLSRRFALGTVCAAGALASLLSTSSFAWADPGEDLDDVFAETTPSVRDVFLDNVSFIRASRRTFTSALSARPGPTAAARRSWP